MALFVPPVAYGIAALLAALGLGATQAGCVTVQERIDEYHKRNPRPRWLTEQEGGYVVGNSDCRDPENVPSHFRTEMADLSAMGDLMKKMGCSEMRSVNFFTEKQKYWEPCTLDGGGIGEMYYVRYRASDFECKPSTFEMREEVILDEKERVTEPEGRKTKPKSGKRKIQRTIKQR